MNQKRMDSWLSEYHERQLKTLEQGINDISTCIRRNRLNILFEYQGEVIHGIVSMIDSKNITIKQKKYNKTKIQQIYSYFTLQPLSFDVIHEWFHEYESDEDLY